MDRTRSEHVNWCKARALEYIERGDCEGALNSIMSDLRKHPETAQHGAIGLTVMLMAAGQLATEAVVRRHIEGFN